MNTIIVAAMLALGCAAAQAQAQAQPEPRLYLTTEAAAPHSMLEGKRVVGIGADTVREIMVRAHIAHTIELLPWKRAYTAALERQDTCVFSTTRTPEREALFKWVGPIGEADWVLMARADRKLRLNSLDDARRYRIGTYNGDARDLYLRARGFDVDPAPNDLLNPRKLMANRIDLWAASIRRGSATIDRMGYAGKIVPVLVFNNIRVYLACNQAVPDELTGRMGVALESMERDGSLQRILHRYDDYGVPAKR
ncbi:substrate-binding periplasmic protein [Massilia aerilata]|uniref:Substrate-binding periplasmic protein n=1 Tax=Massilia aerilata TaxID=453817 RepID=A0ABW0S6T1_9BURK